jgi:Beta-lactamase enzyme family
MGRRHRGHRRSAAGLLTVAALAGLALAPTTAPAKKSKDQRLITPRSVASAARYARRRSGKVAFAVLGEHSRRPRGLHTTMLFPSASVVKAMLLVARLRRVGHDHLSGYDKSLLGPMIRVSDNAAAEAVYASVGRSGLMRVAHVSGMRRFSVPFLFNAQIDAADQVRFFLHIEQHVPKEHRRYAMKLLRSIVGYQRWGIARVARERRMKIFFKGGWRGGISHQVAQLRRGKRRVALAVLTSGEPDGYARETLEGIARRVLR